MEMHINIGQKVPAGIMVETNKLFTTSEMAEQFNALMIASPGLAYVIDNGFKQSLTDAHANIKTGDADFSEMACIAAVEKKLDRIYAGTIRQAGTREASDPIGTEARRIAADWWKTIGDQARKTALTAVMKKNDIDEKSAKSAIMLAYSSQDAVREQAKKVLAVRAPEVTIDLSMLGLVEAVREQAVDELSNDSDIDAAINEE